MSAYLDIFILLLVVVMVFLKFKSLLGTRPDNETKISQESAAKIFDILIQEQNKRAQAQTSPELKVNVENLSEEDKTLSKIPNFSKDNFIRGAKKSFEIIVDAFAKGDLGHLDKLVSKELLEKFQNVIDQRKEEGITTETDFIGFDDAVITSAQINDSDNALISVKFVSEQVNILRNKDGEVLQGDENFIQSITDIWTFERSIHALTPNWLLISTKK